MSDWDLHILIIADAGVWGWSLLRTCSEKGPLHELFAMLLGQFCCLGSNECLFPSVHNWWWTQSIGDWNMIFLIVIFVVINHLVPMLVIHWKCPLPHLILGPSCGNSLNSASGVSARGQSWLREGGEQVSLRRVAPHSSKGQTSRWSTGMVGCGATALHQRGGVSWQHRLTASTPKGMGSGLIQPGWSAPGGRWGDTLLATTVLAPPIENRLSGGGREHDDIMGLRGYSMGGNVNSTWQDAIESTVRM